MSDEIKTEITEKDTDENTVSENPEEKSQILEKLDNTDLINIIKETRQEAGARRIKEKQAKKELEKLKEQMKELKGKYSETSKVLTEAEEKKKAEALEKAGEIEKVTIQMKELAEAKQAYENQLKEQTSVIEQLKTNNALLERKTQIDSLTTKANIQWASDWERLGFINEFSELRDGEFVADEEDVQNAINELKKTKYVAPVTPGTGPKEKTTSAPAEVEINHIIEKSQKGMLLDPDEMAKLDKYLSNGM